MSKPNTVIIQSWICAPCGGCGRRKGENEILDDMDFDRYGKVKGKMFEDRADVAKADEDGGE